MTDIHEEALAILGPSEAISKLREETGELAFAVQRYAEGKGDAESVYRELEDVLFVMCRVDRIPKFIEANESWDIEKQRRESTEKLKKAMADKLKTEGAII
jgi:hypothetical protein